MSFLKKMLKMNKVYKVLKVLKEFKEETIYVFGNKFSVIPNLFRPFSLNFINLPQ